MMNLDGHVKLADFGISKDLSESEIKCTNTYCGTLGYIAPEIYQRKHYNYTADWWSYGCLLYELLTNGSLWFLTKDNDGSFDEEALQKVNF